MSHHLARLTNGTGKLGSVDGLVSIEDVEKIYSDSAQVKSTESFVCANPNCGVSVIAVIIKNQKNKRKRSPSSYFRASSTPHKAGCNREVLSIEPISSKLPDGTKRARPIKAQVPTKWVAVSTERTIRAKKISDSTVSEKNNPHQNSGTSKKGKGTSVSQKTAVSLFAKPWLGMSLDFRKATKLSAPWNPGGTYDSAFRELAHRPLEADNNSERQIYVGIIKNIRAGVSGYTLELIETHVSGAPLRIWVKNETQNSDILGADLWIRLKKGQVKLGSKLFALGEFYPNTRDKHFWYALPIKFGQYIHIE